MSFEDKLLDIDLRKDLIDAHGQLDAELLKKINYKFRLEWNYNSNIMEGNSLTKQETRSVMVGNITVGGKPLKDVLEMKGHDDVVKEIIKMGRGELNISENRIKEVHKLIMYEEAPEEQKKIGVWKAQDNYLYNYRNERVDFVPIAEVKERMHRLINWLNTEKEKIQRKEKDAMHPVALAFKFHLDYITIHPFYDGNGRTARIFTNLILVAYGYPPLYIKLEEKGRYYQYLADVQEYGGPPDLFYDFMGDMLMRSMKLVQDAMQGRDIDEPEDIDKEITLLRYELSNRNDILKAKRTKKVVLDIIKDSVLPVLVLFDEKTKQIEDLFLEVLKNLYWVDSKGANNNIFKGADIDINRIEKNWLQNQYTAADLADIIITDLRFDVILQAFKKTTDDVYISEQIKFYFGEHYYEIYDMLDNKRMIRKPYEDSLNDSEVKKLVNHFMKDMVEKIKKLAGNI